MAYLVAEEEEHYQLKDRDGNIHDLGNVVLDTAFIDKVYQNGNTILYKNRELPYAYFQHLLRDTHHHRHYY